MFQSFVHCLCERLSYSACFIIWLPICLSVFTIWQRVVMPAFFYTWLPVIVPVFLYLTTDLSARFLQLSTCFCLFCVPDFLYIDCFLYLTTYLSACVAYLSTCLTAFSISLSTCMVYLITCFLPVLSIWLPAFLLDLSIRLTIFKNVFLHLTINFSFCLLFLSDFCLVFLSYYLSFLLLSSMTNDCLSLWLFSPPDYQPFFLLCLSNHELFYTGFAKKPVFFLLYLST